MHPYSKHPLHSSIAIMCILCLGVMSLLSVHARSASELPERVEDIPKAVAVVNGEPISRDVFIQRLIADHGIQVLRNLISLTLVEQEAKKRGITVSDQEIKRRFEPLFKAVEKGETEKLARAGLPPDVSEMMLWAEAKKFVLLEKMFRDEVHITEADMRKYYHRPDVYGRFNPEPTYDVREIGVYSVQRAQLIWAELRRAAQKPRTLMKVFRQLATKYSKLPTAKVKGMEGSRGYLALSELPHAYQMLVRTAKPGEIFPPIQVTLGGASYWVILWVRDIKQPQRLSFEEAKSEIERELVTQQLALRSKAFIEELWDKMLLSGGLKINIGALREVFERQRKERERMKKELEEAKKKRKKHQ